MNDKPLHSVSVSGVILDDSERVLLIKRRDNGQWQAPGGVLELHESFEQGVAREVREESGVDVRVEHLSGVYKNLARGVVALVYRCALVAGEAAPSDEASDVMWATMEQVSALVQPVFAVRIFDAIDANHNAASRRHDGEHLLP